MEIKPGIMAVAPEVLGNLAPGSPFAMKSSPQSHSSPLNFLRFLLVAGALAAMSPAALTAAEPKVVEALSLEIIGLPFDHQGPQVIDVLYRMTYAEGIAQKDIPDFEVIQREIKAYLATYPNKQDYLEVVNKNLCLEILKRYPVLGAVAVDIRVYPTMTVPYAQTSHCTASR